MAVGVATFHVKHLATRAFGGEIGSWSGIVSRETLHRVSIRAKDGWGWGATEKRQRPAFPCVGELSRLDKAFHVKHQCPLSVTNSSHTPKQGILPRTPGCLKTFHAKHRCRLSVTNNSRARTRPFARNALFESVSRETNKQSSSGKFYKIRRVL